jgi:hypothetical protein
LKSKEIPPAAIVGVVVVVLLVVGFFAYNSFVKPPDVIDPSTISAERLEDPDPPRTPRP